MESFNESLKILFKKKKVGMVFSPLEQFSIINLIPLRIGNVYLSFTNSALYLLIAVMLLAALFIW
jgi:hypothetical protein